MRLCTQHNHMCFQSQISLTVFYDRSLTISLTVFYHRSLTISLYHRSLTISLSLYSITDLSLYLSHCILSQISHYIDVDLGSLVHDRLTEETELASIDLSKLSTKPLKVSTGIYVGSEICAIESNCPVCRSDLYVACME